MAENIDPFKLLNEEPDSDIGTVLKNPYQVNFRSKEEDIIELYPEKLLFRQAEVDLSNDNVSIKTNLHQGEEKYTIVLSKPNYAVVESLAQVSIHYQTTITAQYYIVSGEETLLYDQNHAQWQTKYNPGVRDVAEITPELYQKAQTIEKQ